LAIAHLLEHPSDLDQPSDLDLFITTLKEATTLN
jgi:hypothetical protein